MNKQAISHPVQFKNQIYNIDNLQLNTLLKISENKGSNIELLFELHNNQTIVGTIISFEGYNPLCPSDVFIPVSCKIQTSEGMKELTFLDIKSIE